MSKKRVEAVAYLGTELGHQRRRRQGQRQAPARRDPRLWRAGYAIVDEFYDAAVKGADPVPERSGFAALLERIRGNGVRTIIVEIANWLARDLRNPGLGHLPSETSS